LVKEIRENSEDINLDSFIFSLKNICNASGTEKSKLSYQKSYGNHMGLLIDKMLSDLKTFKPTISQFIKCANIPMVGNSASEALNVINAKEFINSGFIKSEWQRLLPNIPSRKNIVEYWPRIQALKIIFSELKDTSMVAEIKKTKVAVTGALSTPRTEWYKMHNKLEACSVSKETKYLVTNEPSSSAKYIAAQKIGVPVVTEEEFNKIYSTL
jgi:NAD-dependent DNA ligase